MFWDISNKKDRFRDFFADSAKGFLLIWNASKKLTIINLCLFLLLASIPLVSLSVLKKLIDHAQLTGITWDSLWPMVSLFAGLQLINAAVVQFSSYKLLEQQQLIADDLAVSVLKKAIDLDIEYYENPAFFDELHMAQQQSSGRPAQLISACQGVIQSLFAIFILSAFMFLAHWSVLILILALSIPLAISKMLHGYQQYLQDKDSMQDQRKSNSIFQYLTTDAYAKEVRIFNFGNSFIQQFLTLRKSIFNRKKHLQYKFLKQNLTIQFFEIIITTLIYLIIIGSALSGAITIGGLVIYFQVFQRLQASITSLFQSGISLVQNQLYLRQILRYLEIPSFVKNNPGAPVPSPMVKGISIENLNFTYPQTQKQILADINMSFRPGTLTAIVGENGSGKSTLIKLLCRLYEPETDSISLDGVAVQNIDLAQFRENITVVFQDFGKYYMTIEENIAPGNGTKNDAELGEAAQMAGLSEKIKSYTRGYKTQLGRTFNNGEQLSGGQWQKIAIARMFYKKSQIVILDEPTSSMDPVAEQIIFQNVKKHLGNKIVILITHRLYNLKMADNIYLLENGSIIEQGKFDELLIAGGTFASIYDKQKI